MASAIILPSAVLHFAGPGAHAEHALLVFGNRRPSRGVLDTLCGAMRRNGDRLTVVRVSTLASTLRRLAGRPSPGADLEWASRFVSERGVACDGTVRRERSLSVGILDAVRRSSPDLVCVVLADVADERAMRRALAVVGRMVEGRLIVDAGGKSREGEEGMWQRHMR